MKITYNLQVLPQRKNSRKDSEETTALKAFLADSEKKNMVFEYDTPQEAKKRYDSMRNYKLMDLANSLRWPEHFALDNSRLCTMINTTAKRTAIAGRGRM